jgi:hypothetical protein
MNVRFKTLFAPFGHKTLMEHFELLSLSPLSRLGMDRTVDRS